MKYPRYRKLYYMLYDAVAGALVEFNRGNDANMVCMLEKVLEECDGECGDNKRSGQED